MNKEFNRWSSVAVARTILVSIVLLALAACSDTSGKVPATESTVKPERTYSGIVSVSSANCPSLQTVEQIFAGWKLRIGGKADGVDPAQGTDCVYVSAKTGTESNGEPINNIIVSFSTAKGAQYASMAAAESYEQKGCVKSEYYDCSLTEVPQLGSAAFQVYIGQSPQPGFQSNRTVGNCYEWVRNQDGQVASIGDTLNQFSGIGFDPSQGNACVLALRLTELLMH
jgi:hypothetical protein